MFWHTFGFNGIGDFISTTIGMKSTVSIFAQLATATFLGYYGCIEKYIYSPAQAVVMMICLVVVDTILGAMVAIKKGEKFNLAKISRLLPILCAHVMVMSATWHFKQIDIDAYGWMPSATFGFLGVRNLLSVIRNMIKLKYIRADFLSFLNTKIDSDLLTSEEEPEKGKNILPIILILISLSSCMSYERCARKYGNGFDTVYVSVRDTVNIHLPGDSVSGNLTDSILKAMEIGQEFEFENPPAPIDEPNTSYVKTPIKLRIKKTGNGQYTATATVKPKYLQITKTIKAKCPPCPKFKPSESFMWKWLIIGAMAGIGFTVIVNKIRA